MKRLYHLAWLSLALRIIYLPLPDLLAQEAYYWNYAANLDIGYLDHPPLSAWLIALSQYLFGVTEFAVRLPALLCAVVTASFVYALAKDMGGVEAARASLVQFALLPFFFGASFFMSPDAPLLCCWSAALFFAWRILRSEQQTGLWSDWLLLGTAFGLGMLSKYTIALCGFAFALMLVLYRPARGWILKPQPWVAAAVALLWFSPVIYWNATHDWVSFVFQGTRRLEARTEFSLHLLLLHLLILVTPAGFLNAALVFSPRWAADRLQLLFARTFFLVPVAVFAFFSLQHEPKFIWCGPAFLALMPIFGSTLLRCGRSAVPPLECWTLALWRPFLGLSLAGMAIYLTYLGPGIPLLPYSERMNKTIGWEDLGREVHARAIKIEAESGIVPVVIGMDKHYVAAELAFYLAKIAGRQERPPPPVAGRSIVGMVGLMWHFWRPQIDLTDRPAILVARSKSDLEFAELKNYFSALEPIVEFHAKHSGKPAGTYFMRSALGYREPAGAPSIGDFFKPD